MKQRLASSVLGSVALLAALIVVLQPDTAEGATLTVNSTADTNDGACSALAGANECTLREALSLAQNTDTISFNIPAADPNCTASQLCTFTPATPYPLLNGADKLLNGYLQTGASPNTLPTGNNAVIKIQIDLGSLAAGSAFEVTGSDITVRGLAIYGSAGVAFGTAPAITLDGSDGAIIRGNFLGLLASGADGGNGDVQTFGIYMDSATNSEIGGTGEAQRNVISALDTGIFISLSSSDNAVIGNYIGTTPAGGAARANNTGILLNDSTNTRIGDPTNIAGRNVISGNTWGIKFANGAENPGLAVQGNYIGLNASGNAALGNDYGIQVEGGATIGGAIGGVNAGNIISGNDVGIRIESDDTVLNIEGNRIGTNPAGTAAIGNAISGVAVLDADEVTVGGATAGQGNLISGNGIGVRIAPDNAPFEDIRISGNQIGTNLAGTAAIPNTQGVVVALGRDVIIGGETVAERNVISGNTVEGVLVETGVDDTIVENNYIGTTLNGLAALPNSVGIVDFGSGFGGIGTEIRRNIVSGNANDGLIMEGEDFLIEGNFIGTSALLTPLGNGGDGVFVRVGSTGRIRNIDGGANNVIANNGDAGIFIEAGPPDASVTIAHSNIYNNGGLGIDIATAGVTPNDPQDPDGGSNGHQNWPVLTSANQGSTLIRGALDSTPSRTFSLELFSVNTCDPSGNGEGFLYRGSAEITTDASGFVEFAVLSPETVQLGDQITATVTDTTTGHTSEFSNCVAVQSAPTPGPSPTGSVTPTPTPIPIETPPPSDGATQTPTPTATATPTSGSSTATATPAESGAPVSPTPTPTGVPDHRQGDNDCSGSVNGRDSLFAFLSLAQLTAQGFPPCPIVGADLGFIWGDVDCDGDVDDEDALAILWWLAGFDVPQTEPCTDIGEVIPS